MLTRGSSTAVEQLPHQLKVEGSSPSVASGTGKGNGKKFKCLAETFVACQGRISTLILFGSPDMLASSCLKSMTFSKRNYDL